MEEKFKALINNEDFLKKLESCKDTVEISALFAENGIDISAEQLNEMASKAIGQELTADQLESISGGDAGVIVKAVSIAIKFGLFFYKKIKG